MKKLLIINLGLLVFAGLIAPTTGEVNIASSNSVQTPAVQSLQISVGNADFSNNLYLDAWQQSLNSFPDLSTYGYEIVKSSHVYNLENYYTVDGSSEGLAPETYYDDSECSTRCIQFIQVNSNEDLERFPGSGTETDPYVIEGFSFTYHKTNMIQIQNTDVFVVVRNNALSTYYGDYNNILIHNTEHVTIEHNNLTGNWNGIKVTNSSDVTINNNRISEANQNGIFLENVDEYEINSNEVVYNENGVVIINSSNGTFSNNHVTYNWGTGVSFAYSDNNSIVDNKISDNGVEGLVFVDSDDNNVLHNEITRNGYGGYDGDYYDENSLRGLSVTSSRTLTINGAFGGSGFFMDPSFNNIVTDNEISDNNGIGLYLEESANTTISANNIDGNGLNGIFFQDSHKNVITKNNITSNGYSSDLVQLSLNFFDFVVYGAFGGSGFFMDPSEGNVVTDNHMDGNYANGLILQESTNTIISSNTMDSNGLTGVFFQDSHGNDVVGNQITNNGETGLGLATMSAKNFMDMKLMGAFGGSGFFMDPSYNNTLDNNVLSGNAGNGLFLLESDNSVVINNQILSNGADGVFLANSSHNGFTSNLVAGNGYLSFNYLSSQLDLDNIRTLGAFGGSGFFMDPSEDNTLSENLVLENAASGIYFLEIDNSEISNNIIGSNGFDGILFENSNMNNISYNSIEYNGFSLADTSETGLSVNGAFGGSGFFMDPSFMNLVAGNNFTGNAAHGFISEASSNTEFRGNRVMNHSSHGVVLDQTTSETTIFGNNFENNNNGSTQGLDDGFENQFASNFWSDADNTDENYDGIADNPYLLDGSAENADETPSNIPNGLNFYEPIMWVYPNSMSLQSHGIPIVVTVLLGDGFIAKTIDLDKLWLNKTINPIKAVIKHPLIFKLVFERQAVIDLIKTLDLEQLTHHHKHVDVVLELTGRINDDLLDLTAYQKIKLTHDHRHTHKWFRKWGGFIPVAGSLGIIPVIRKRKPDEDDL